MFHKVSKTKHTYTAKRMEHLCFAVFFEDKSMKIAICDDSMKDLTTLEGLLEKYKTLNPNAGFQLEKFSNSSALYEKIQKKELADIYILDILMSRATGIDLGNEIRKNSSESAIIYITSSDDFALDAFHIHAVRYLLKPVSEHQFFEALNYAFSYAELKKGPLYPVKTKTGLQSVPYSKIEYVENASRMLNVHLTDGGTITSIFIRKSFEEELGELIHNSCFLQVHKSFLINLNHVKKLDRNTVLMGSGAIIPVSKKNTSNVKRQYLLFVSEQY